MEVILAKTRGFCFGVKRAIEMARKLVAEPGATCAYCLGELIHNPQVVRQLEQKGLRVVSAPSEADPGASLLIRSHGVSPAVEREARRRGLKIVDATCVLVRRAQKLVRQLHEEGYRVVIIGDADHPEVRSVLGCAPGIICIDSAEQIDKLSPCQKMGVISQTTQPVEHFGDMVGRIAAKGCPELKVVNTICRETQQRQSSALDVAGKVEVMFVLGGRGSANTTHLAQLCRGVCARTYHLEGWDQFRPEMASGGRRAGLTGGASTPEWTIDQFATELEKI